MTMTLTGTNAKESRKLRARAFWLKARRFLGATAGVTGIAYLLGYTIADGLSGMFLALPKAIVGTFAVSLVAGWVPVGFYYEGHRYRWAYIGIYFAIALVAAFFIGYAVGSAG